MKRLAPFFVVSTFLTAPATAQDWTTINLGITDDLHEFNYGGFSDKWLSGDNGFLAWSVDLQNWTIVSTGSTGDFPSIVRWTSNGFLVGGGAGVVRRSLDSGTTWLAKNIPDATQNFSLYSRSSGWANAVGDLGDIYQTQSVGDSWFVVHAGTTPLHDGSGFIGSRSWAVGDDGLVLITEDGGTTWTVQPTGYTDDLHAFLENGNALFAAGENGTILRSADFGVTWERLTTGTTETFRDIRSSAISGSIMYAVGDNGMLIRSTNFGDDWCRIDPQTTENLRCVFGNNANVFSVGGENGLLLFTETGGGNCDDIVPVEPDPQLGVPTPPVMALAAPHPNPFGASTAFSFGVPVALHGADVDVTVFDVAGRAVRHLVDTVGRSGAFRVSWDGTDDRGSRVANGMYIVRLRAGTETAQERVMVVR